DALRRNAEAVAQELAGGKVIERLGAAPITGGEVEELGAEVGRAARRRAHHVIAGLAQDLARGPEVVVPPRERQHQRAQLVLRARLLRLQEIRVQRAVFARRRQLVERREADLLDVAVDDLAQELVGILDAIDELELVAVKIELNRLERDRQRGRGDDGV